MSNNKLSIFTSKRMISGRKWVKFTIYTGLVVILAMLPVFLNSPYTLDILSLTFMYSIAATSIRTITISGQFPLAHGSFMGIGAYAAGMASKWLGWPFWITIPMGGLVAMCVGLLIGYPFSRLRALYYAMGSLFFGIGIINIICAGGVLTGGATGITGIKPIFTSPIVPYYFFFLGLALFSLLALYRFEFCRIGETLKAIAQSHVVASSVGINESLYRILAVGIGCFFVGLAGAGYAHYKLTITPGSFDFMVTLWLVMYVLIGGINSFWGPIIGTFVMILLPQYFFRGLQAYSPYISASILLIVVFVMPDGLVGLPQLVRSWVERRKGKMVTHDS